jgi:FkbM family methyltransferase
MLKKIVGKVIFGLFPSLYVWRLRRLALSTPLSESYLFEAEAKIIRSLVSEDQVFMDVGSHDGFYSFLVEDIVGSDNVYSFEPIPSTFARLKHYRRHPNVFQLALSDSIGQQTIRIPMIAGKRVMTRATLEADVREVNETGYEKITIQTSTIDAFTQTKEIKNVGFIKIDVEGHELHVVKGAIETLEKFQPTLMIEIEQRHHTQPLRDILNYVESLGFSGYYFDVPSLSLKPLSNFSVEKNQNFQHHRTTKYVQNFLFFPLHQQEVIIKRVQAALQLQGARQPELVSQT